MKKFGIISILRNLFLLVCVSVLFIGCGTTKLLLNPNDSKINFNQYSSLIIQTSTKEGIVVSEAAQNRIKDLVKSEINSKYCVKRFEKIITNNYIQPPQYTDLIVNIKFTKYDEGSRFARAMLAGLGGIKILADIEIKNPINGNIIIQGEAGKSFAWGGVVGASTSIEDIEKTFAKEVAKGIGEMFGIKPIE